MSYQSGPPTAWTRPKSVDPAVVLGEAIEQHLWSPRLQRLLRTLPGGSVLLKRYPLATRRPGIALRAVWTEGLASQFRARAAALSPAFLEALDQAGWQVPEGDARGDTSAELVPPVLMPHHRRLAAEVRKRLREPGGAPVVLVSPPGGGASEVAALVVEDPRTHEAFTGGVWVAHGLGPGGLLDLFRDIGAERNLPRLARAADLHVALAQFRQHFQRGGTLLVIVDVDDYRAVRRLWGGLGPGHRVLLTSPVAVPDQVPAHRLRVEPPTQAQTEALFGLWAGAGAQSAAARTLARAVAGRRGLAIRSARLVGGPRPTLSPSELLATFADAAQRGDAAEIEEAAIDAGLQGASPILTETMLAVGVLPPAPAVLPDDLLCSVVGAERWGMVRNQLGEAGLVECVGTGRWRVPKLVSRVVRRRGAQVPQLAASARRAALHWARRRLRDAADGWTTEGALSLRARELRADRLSIIGIIGRDPLGVLDPTDIPFGLVAWLLPHAQVRTLIARSSKLAGHPWRGAAWRWLADDLVHAQRRKDAARLLSAVIREAHRTGDVPETIDATIRLSRVQYDRGNLVDARELLASAVREAERIEDHRREAEACLALGDLLETTGQREAAVQALWRAVALFRDEGAHAQAAEATGRLGLLARQAGQLDVAAERFRMQAALADAAQDRDGVSVAERRLGRLALDAGDAERAVYWLERALRAWDQDGADTDGVCRLLATLAEAQMATGQVEAALSTARRRIDESRKRGDLSEETEAVAELAMLLARTGARDEALALVSAALRRDRAFGDKRGEAQHLLAAGVAHGPRRVPSQAVVCFEAARSVAEEVGWREGVARALEGIAIAEATLGQLGPALRDGRAALAIYQRHGDPTATARWQVLFGGVLIAAGSAPEGRRLMSSGAQALAQLGWSQAQIATLVDGGAALSLGA